MASWADLGTSAEINALTALVLLLAFSVWRLQPQNARVYFPKWYIKGVRKASVVDPSARKISVTKFVNLNYKAYLKLFNWIPEALKMPEQDLIDHAGLDSVAFLRIFVLGLKIFLPIAGFGLSILVPVNMTDKALGLDDGQNINITYTSIDKLSIANVTDKSIRLWAHLLMSYVFSIWICFVLYSEFRTITNMRIRHLMTRKRAPDQFTVLVRQVPHVPEKSIKATVEDFFRLNHREYLQTEVVKNANKLAGILEKIAKLENWLQYSEIKFEKNPKTIPTKKLGFLGLCGKKVDAIEYYTEEIEKLKEQAKEEYEIVLTDSKLVMPAAFVSFKSRGAAAVCAQTQQTRNTTKWITEWAPEPRDVYWRNLAIPYLSLTMRNVLMGAALVLIVLFYFPFILLVQSFANLNYIQRHFQFLRPMLNHSQVNPIIEGFLPGLILKIFLAVLPYLLMVMAKFEGHLSRSALDKVSATKQYYFVVVAVFFGSVITGSVASQLQVILNSKSVTDVLTILGNSIPMKATFFITYIMVDGWAGFAWEIVRLIPLIMYHIKNVVLVRTPRDRDRAMAPGNLLFNQNIPRLELYFLLGIVYCVMSPIIVPFIIVAFGFGYLVFRNQVINVYEPDYDSAAAFWPHVHARVIVAMVIQQLTLIGVFTIKGPIGFVKEDNLTGTRHKALKYLRQLLSSTPFMVLLPIGTLVFQWYCRRRFHPAFENYPMEETGWETYLGDTKSEDGLHTRIVGVLSSNMTVKCADHNVEFGGRYAAALSVVQDANAKDRQERKDSPDLDLEEYLDKAYLNPALKAEENNLLREKVTVGQAGGKGNSSPGQDLEKGGNPGRRSPRYDMEGRRNLEAWKEEEEEEEEDDVNEPRMQIDNEQSPEEFLDALSRQTSFQGDESPNNFRDESPRSFYDSTSSSPQTNRQ